MAAQQHFPTAYSHLLTHFPDGLWSIRIFKTIPFIHYFASSSSPLPLSLKIFKLSMNLTFVARDPHLSLQMVQYRLMNQISQSHSLLLMAVSLQSMASVGPTVRILPDCSLHSRYDSVLYLVAQFK